MTEGHFAVVGRRDDGVEEIFVCSSLEEIEETFPDLNYDEFKVILRNGYTDRDLLPWEPKQQLLATIREKTGTTS